MHTRLKKIGRFTMIVGLLCLAAIGLHWLINSKASGEKLWAYRPRIESPDAIRKQTEAAIDEWHYDTTAPLVKTVKDTGSVKAINQIIENGQERDKRVALLNTGAKPDLAVKTLPSTTTTLPGEILKTPQVSIKKLTENSWSITVPGNTEVFTQIKVHKDQHVEFSDRTGIVKLNANDPFVNPPQGLYPAILIKPNPEEFILHGANEYAGSLICRIGTFTIESENGYFDVGGRNGDRFPAKQDGEIVLAINSRKNETIFASGYFEVTITIY